jgi:hypothetical protein
MQSSPCTGNPKISHVNSKFIKNNVTTSKEIVVMVKKKKRNIQSKRATQSKSTPNKKVTLEKRQAKKDVVLGTEKKGRLPLIAAVVCSVLIIGGGIYYASYDRQETAAVAGSFTSENNASQVSLSASLFEDGKARHFQHLVETASFGLLLMPVMSAGRRAKAIIRKVIIWSVATAAVNSPPFWSMKLKAGATRHP